MAETLITVSAGFMPRGNGLASDHENGYYPYNWPLFFHPKDAPENPLMIDHFRFAAPIYDRVLGPPNTDRLKRLLDLPVSGWLLDAGGGTGRVSAPLAAWTGYLAVADISRPMLRRARNKPLFPIGAGAERLPFADNTFHRVLVVDSLHHFSDPGRSLTEFFRVLKPGGRLLVEEPDIRRFIVKLGALGEKLLLMGSRFLSPAQILHICGAVGFTARIAESDLFRVWIIGDKPLNPPR